MRSRTPSPNRPLWRRFAPALVGAVASAALASHTLAEPPPGGANSGGNDGGVLSFGDPSQASAPVRTQDGSLQTVKDTPPDAKAAKDAKPAPDAPPKPVHKKRKPKPKPKPQPPALPLPPLGLGAPMPPPPGGLAALFAADAASFTDYRPLDAENTLIIDTTKGRIVVELRPDFAPASVARLKTLARRGVYDGLLFHRVIEDFVDQTGNPNNRDGGKSDEPNLPPEFTFRLGADLPRALVARPQGETEGFIGASPYVSVDEQKMAYSPDHRVSAWGAYCSGVVGMGRDADPNSGNSEFFLMRQAARRLEREYTAVGIVVQGLDVVRTVNVGEPPVHPDKMVKVSVMSDLPDNERPRLRVLNTLSPQFATLVAQVRAIRGADFSICDIEVPTRPQ